VIHPEFFYTAKRSDTVSVEADDVDDVFIEFYECREFRDAVEGVCMIQEALIGIKTNDGGKVSVFPCGSRGMGDGSFFMYGKKTHLRFKNEGGCVRILNSFSRSRRESIHAA
jgi:hypothetical protein